MNVTLLGTAPSEGVPVPLCGCEFCSDNHRMRPSLHIKTENRSVLLDASPDVRIQLHNNAIHSVDDILITHIHSDHSGGLKGLYNITEDPNSGGSTRTVHSYDGGSIYEEFDLYCSPDTLNGLRDEIGYVLSEHGYRTHTIENHQFDIGAIQFESFTTDHTSGYTGFVAEHNEDTVVYNPDQGTIRSDVEFNDVDVLVFDASALLGHESHGSSEEALSFIDRVDADKIYFTNVSEHVSRVPTDRLEDLIGIDNGYVVDDGTRIL